MSAQRGDPSAEAIQGLHDRYLLEVVEDLSLCPFARRCREQGRLARPLFYAEPGESEPDAVARTLVALARAEPEVEVVLLTFVLPRATDHPWHDVDDFENYVRAVRDAYEALRPSLRFYMVGFHPGLRGPDPRRPATPDGLVPRIRRTPDPVIQCIRADLLDQVRRQAQVAANARFLEEMGKLGPEYRAMAMTAIQSDPELSADIARHNFENVGTGPGRATLEARLAEL
ncbi:MAG TPA: DUF1415 family protein, partial [Nannocystis sp.]